MNKAWRKTAEATYAFSVDGKEAGTMGIMHDTKDSRALISMQGDEIMISRTGFWKSGIEITGKNGKVIAKVYSEKWYANRWALEYGGEKYELSIRNNPLAEWVIQHNGKDLLAYGLHTGNKNGMVNIRISSFENTSPSIFDFLLWYLFLPVATENMGDNFTFTLLQYA
jgi:hypothetical protein